MRYWLAPDVHAVDVVGDIVFLAIASDTYFCLADGGAHLTLSDDGGVDAAPQAAADLVAAGLLSHNAPSTPRARPPRPLQDLSSVSGLAPRGGPLRWARAIRANVQAAQAIRALSFADVLKLAAPGAASVFDAPSPGLLGEAAAFDRMTPWLPRDGVCLMRSLQQRLYLARLGYSAAWVFGVRTWPFEAHCWLQAGDVVLDDTAEHAVGFTPILVV